MTAIGLVLAVAQLDAHHGLIAGVVMLVIGGALSNGVIRGRAALDQIPPRGSGLLFLAGPLVLVLFGLLIIVGSVVGIARGLR